MFIGWKIAEFFFHIIHSQGSTDCQVRRPTGPTWSENFKFFWSGHRLSKSCSSWSGSVPVWDSQIFKLFLVLVQTGPWFSNFVVSPVRRFCDRCTGVFVDWLVRAYVLVDGKLQCFFFQIMSWPVRDFKLCWTKSGPAFHHYAYFHRNDRCGRKWPSSVIKWPLFENTTEITVIH